MSKIQVSLILILLGAGAVYFLLLPQWEAFRIVQADHAAAAAAITELQDLAAKRDELTATYNDVEASLLDKVDDIIPASSETSGFLADLEAIANRNQMVMKSVDFSQTVSLGSAKTAPKTGAAPSQTSAAKPAELNLKSELSVLPLNLEVTGRYDNFRKFLNDLELNQRLMDVGVITFNSRQGGAGSDIFDFTVQAKAYYQ